MHYVREKEVLHRRQGRDALENYLYIRPYDYPTLHDFLEALEQHYDILKSFAGDMSDQVRIWHCINMLEEADPHWENRLHAFKSRRIRKTKHKKKLDKIMWELFLSWDDFVWNMVDRGGEMNFREPVEVQEQKPQPQPSAQPPIDKPAPVQPAAKQAVETQLPIRTAPAATTSSPPPATNTTSEAISAGFVIVKDVAKNASAKDRPVKASNGQSRRFDQNGSTGNKTTRKTSSSTTKLDKPTPKTSTTVNNLGDDEDYVDIPEGGYADDLNYEDVDDVTVDNDRDEKDIVHVNGEVRYQIPGYASRKKPRHTLISAPRFVIKKFFRSKFPGRPRCSDCGCQHPTERYMLCSHCDFCHVGGNSECYHQHPELRGTRPDKDKYRRPASPASASSEPDVDALSDVESDSETIKGANDDTAKIDSSAITGNSSNTGNPDNLSVKRAAEGDLANNLGSLTIFEKSVDRIEFVRDQTPEVIIFNSPQATPVGKETGPASNPSSKVDLPIREKTDEKASKAADDISQITAKLESTSVSAPSPAPTLAPIPTPIAATPAAAPVRNRQAVLAALSAPSAPPPTTSATLSKTDTAEGGAPLNVENLGRVPHDQSHRRWASMSSLTTSSSGESLIAFRRRRTNQVKKSKAAAEKAAADEAAAERAAAERAAAEKAASDKLAAAEKAVAEKAVAEKAAAEKAAAEREAKEAVAARETLVNEKRLEVEERLRRERRAEEEAKRQAQDARDHAALEERLARQDEQRIANKKAKAARKRARQKERRREREEEERLQQEQGWGHTSSTSMHLDGRVPA